MILTPGKLSAFPSTHWAIWMIRGRLAHPSGRIFKQVGIRYISRFRIELGDGEQASSTFAIGPSNREGESAAEGLRKRQQTSPDSKKPESRYDKKSSNL